MENILRVKRENAFDYPIIWENDFTHLCECVGNLKLSASKICIVSDSIVAPLYAEQVKEQLSSGYRVDVYVIPAGEEHKNLDTIRDLYRFLIVNKYSRKDILLALGGGVIGDMTGFAAATYLRGIDFIQVPTTLLAQVDSSVGGKTGVDFEQFKNMVGAFHQPRLVYMNMTALDTLSDTLFACGMGEILKSALIKDAAFYQWLAENRHKIKQRDKEAMAHMIRECCRIKSEVVESDPTEQGIRAILNFGHTIGHAVEKLMHFSMLHGQCVGVGMIAAAWLSVQRGILKESDLSLICELNHFYDLPGGVQGLKADDILQVMASDKKASDGSTKFVLLDGIGHAVIETLPVEALRPAVTYILREES